MMPRNPIVMAMLAWAWAFPVLGGEGDPTPAATPATQPAGDAVEPAESAEPAKPDPKVLELLAKLGDLIEKSEKAKPEVKAFCKKELLSICTNKVLVKQVKEQNDKKVSLDDIKKTDKEWLDAEDELAIHKEKLNNDCAKELKKIVKKLEVVGEAFVMDDQGANVGQNVLTSDYWQGDEPKWQNSFAKGKGGVEFGKAELDKSSNMVLQQVSLPIIAQDGTVIGAVCLGLKVEKIN